MAGRSTIGRGRVRRIGGLLLLAVLTLYTGDLAAQQHFGELVRVNPYFAHGTRTLDGWIVGKVVISGPPEPPQGPVRTMSELPEPRPEAGVNILPNVPAFDWSFGCSPTSAAMISGYYDRTAFPNMYVGPTNGGVMPLDNSVWPDWTDGCWEARHQCPLSASHDGLDGRVGYGHVDDYWVCYGDAGPDPYEAGLFDPGWPEHAPDCTADFMKTSQAAFGNTDGSTTFYYYPSGAKYTGVGDLGEDGGYGLERFYESRGYTVIDRYNRVLLGYDWDSEGSEYTPATDGATFDDYKAEIDAGRPVMIHVEGHTMVGVGYDDSSNLVYLQNTWDYGLHSMTWGGYYAGMLHFGITVVTLAEPEIDARGSGISIPDGDTTPSTTDGTDFGWVALGEGDAHLFTLHNTGAETLRLTGSPTVQIGGAHPADFSVTSQPEITALAPGDSTSFVVRFAPSAVGVRTSTITIANTDLNENPYSFAIQGAGDDPDDTTPPSPDPLTWSALPALTDATTIGMTATTATDSSGVQYYFEETTGNPGGDDSGWQDDPTYTDGGLDLDTSYCYRVNARDRSSNHNETGWSVGACATTAPAATPATFRVTAEGTVAADGTVHARAFETASADVAEWVSVSEPVTPGTVVELDPTRPGSYRPSTAACSDGVAGVISSEPGVVLGTAAGFEERALLALVGIVPTRATDEGGPILPGDLLVASSTPGYAMRWSGDPSAPCVLVGKALGPMADEAGTILVLLTAH